MQNQLRPITKEDIPALKVVLDSIELFPAEMLDGLVEDFLTNPDTQDIWFTYTIDDQPIALAYCAPEKLTDGTYNLYAIGIKSGIQGKGIGKKMMDHLENLLQKAGHRILIVETSGGETYNLTRAFYLKCGYTQEATIREFWGPGEDKVVFWKKLDDH